MRFAYADKLAVGLAGEHITCAGLLALGHAPFRAGQAAPYDIAVDTGTGRLVRLQVKSAIQARPYPQQRQQHITGYTWNMRHGKGANRRYADGLVDGFALVALDIRRVAYLAPGRVIFQIPVSGSRKPRSRNFDDYDFDVLLKGLTE